MILCWLGLFTAHFQKRVTPHPIPYIPVPLTSLPGAGSRVASLPSHKAALTGRGRLSTLRVNLSDAALKLSPNQL